MKSIKAYTNSPLELPDDAVILYLSPFPPDGQWGGPIRAEQEFAVMKDIYPNSKMLHVHQLPVHIDENMPKWMDNEHPQLNDILMLFKDFHTQNYLDNIPDAVVCSHPWLWTETKKLKKMFPELKIIHSSHNIEFVLKHELLADLPEKDRIEAIKYIRNVEEEIAREADLVICVTELDKMWFINNGAKQVVACNNGTTTQPSKIASTNPYAVVIGSGHPPNVEGSIKYLYDAPNWLPEASRLIYAGSMCDGLKGNVGREISLSKKSEVVFLGVRPKDDLEKLIASASVILLPIPYGGGSNLKTAEALASGRPVVGTTKSFRGFEGFIGSRNVVVTDDIEEFKEACYNFVSEKLPTVYRHGWERLLWKATLTPLREYLKGN